MKGEELWLVIVDMTNVVINTVVDRLVIIPGLRPTLVAVQPSQIALQLI